MKKFLTPIILSALVVAVPVLGRAQTANQNPTLRQLATKVKTDCKHDLQKYCKNITPGQGRLAACLDANENKLSQSCHMTWMGAKDNVSNRVSKAELSFRKNCGTDVQRFCSNVPSGGGRLLDCISQHKYDLSNSCSAFTSELDQKLANFLG